jgi:glycosyltransferase involved in cell wall biosynthesis
LRAGGGTRLKILEALAAGCPTVSTPVGVEGLRLAAGEHLRVAETPEAFAQAILDLLGDQELRTRLARAGRVAVAERYDWRPIAVLLEAACELAASRAGAS